MFTGCQVASAQSQYLGRDRTGVYPGLDANGQMPMQNSGSLAVCSLYQGQTYNSNVMPPVPNSVPVPSKPAPVPPPAVKLGQEGFKKVCRREEDSPSPFPGLPSGILEMRVKEGSKIRNLMGFAMARMQGERKSGTGGSGTGGSGTGGDGGLRQVVFAGSGRAVTKTITCAEIMKRKVGSLHQLTKLRYKTVKEVWESSEGGATDMTVHRSVPSISILLSKDPLDPTEPGYQPPETLGALWDERESFDSSQSAACKRPPGPSPYSAALPPGKRACLGEGAAAAFLPQ